MGLHSDARRSASRPGATLPQPALLASDPAGTRPGATALPCRSPPGGL